MIRGEQHAAPVSSLCSLQVGVEPLCDMTDEWIPDA